MIDHELIEEAEELRREGQERAALQKQFLIKAHQLALLEAILHSPNRTATTDDAGVDLEVPFEDGGRWRGSVPTGLRGLIESVSVTNSARPSRHRGYVTVWHGLDDAAIAAKCAELRGWLSDHSESLGLDLADIVGLDLTDHEELSPREKESERG
jgi:hypothetical protein